MEEICEVSQLCADLKCGIEGAIHAANDLFDSNDYGMLVVDACNAFNNVNWLSFLWNVQVLWPRVSCFVLNTYRGWATLVVRGCKESLYSREGVVQGDPLSMFLYAIANHPTYTHAQGSLSVDHGMQMILLLLGTTPNFIPGSIDSALLFHVIVIILNLRWAT